MFPIVISVIVFTFQISALPHKSCTTPDGKNGTCISLYNCPHIFRITEEDYPTQEQILFVRNSKCGGGISPLVCCSPNSKVPTTSTATTTTTTAPTTATTTTATTTTPTTSPRKNLAARAGPKDIPDRQHCGIEMADRILYGFTTDIGEFSWMAILLYKHPSLDNLKFGCGGSLISPRYVLTAAHCLTGPILTNLGPLVQVTLGDWNISSTKDCLDDGIVERCAELPINADVEKVIPHEDYDPFDINGYNDIGLVKLQQDVKYTMYIKPICLPKYYERSKVGQKVWTSGWGNIGKVQPSEVKLKMGVPVADKEKCIQKYTQASITLIESQICAGGTKLRDSCQGDSGGPLMATVNNDASQWYIEGILSFGTSECGELGWSGIYTKVSSYLDWIYENVD